MIEIKNVQKHFDGITAVDNVTVTVNDGSVFGLIGTNGAGKSTLIRVLAGVLRPQSGTITIDNMPVYDNPAAKQLIFFIADEPYFFQDSCAESMQVYYSGMYKDFDTDMFYEYLSKFGLDKKRKISTYSKGMKKQLALLLGLSSKTKYLICDETFDGLDPVMRQSVKSLMVSEMETRGLTPIIASHNLRELEDICDYVGLLHRGGIVMSKDLEDMKCNISKVQCVFNRPEDLEKVETDYSVISKDTRGRLITMTIRASRKDLTEYFNSIDTLFFEVLPLSLEEIFISEMEDVGYDVRKLILG